MKCTRITFDFENKKRESYEKTAQIICSSHWGSSIDIFGVLNKDHQLLYDFITKALLSLTSTNTNYRNPAPTAILHG